MGWGWVGSMKKGERNDEEEEENKKKKKTRSR
jgi:hypothetical protein